MDKIQNVNTNVKIGCAVVAGLVAGYVAWSCLPQKEQEKI